MPSLSQSGVARDLQLALGLIRSGRRDEARAYLSRLISTNPTLPDAHWLMAGLHSESGDAAGARRFVESTLSLDPGRASAHALLGEILLREGDDASAERSLRNALRLQPEHLPAAIQLGCLLLRNNHADQALTLADRFINKGVRNQTLMQLRAQSLGALGKYQQSAEAFEQLLSASPDSYDARIGLAAALGQIGRVDEAETLACSCLRGNDTAPETHFVLARILLARQQLDEATAHLLKAVHARPDYAVAQTNLSELIWMRTGNIQNACSELDSALRLRPDLTELRIAKANLLEAAQAPDAALVELQKGIGTGGDFTLYLAMAQIALKFDAAKALEYSRLALQGAPDDSTALLVYCGALLGAGHADEAEPLASRLRSLLPNDSQVIAFQATAWRLLGDPRYKQLYDYRYVLPQFIDKPQGWPTRAAYLIDLAKALHHLHAFRTHPVGQSLRTGSQTDLILDRAEAPAIRAFTQAIDGPIRHYMKHIVADPSSFAMRNTNNYKLNGAWSVRLRPNGHHVNHVHPDGWLSSACYIELPGVEHNREGWIQFGQPGVLTSPPLAAEHFVKPEPGLLVLFPSYMWHGTIPFSGPDKATRLTIAFDVVPA